MDADDLVTLLSDYWNGEYLTNLGADFDGPSFMLGYPDGFREGALAVWEQVWQIFPEVRSTGRARLIAEPVADRPPEDPGVIRDYFDDE